MSEVKSSQHTFSVIFIPIHLENSLPQGLYNFTLPNSITVAWELKRSEIRIR
jgi:hypothetical protein